MDKNRKLKMRKGEKKMAIDCNLVRKIPKRFNYKNTNKSFTDAITIEEMECQLGFENIRPIIGLTPSEEQTLLDDAETFEELYIEELIGYYAKRNR